MVQLVNFCLLSFLFLLLPASHSKNRKAENEFWLRDSESSSTHSQESQCPSINREDAIEMGRTCLRKCRTDSNCISSKKRCLCDGVCGWSCVRPDLKCDQLQPIPFGKIKVSGDHFGARATYSCDPAYFMAGTQNRICQGDGSWSDQPPSCKREALCDSPNTILHAKHNADSGDRKDFSIGSIVQYECFVGYEAEGFPHAKCLFFNGSAQWMGPDLKCLPKPCPEPEPIDSGYIQGDSFVFTSKITYHCKEGFNLIGLPTRYCQSDGSWSGSLPSCERKYRTHTHTHMQRQIHFLLLYIVHIVSHAKGGKQDSNMKEKGGKEKREHEMKGRHMRRELKDH